MGNGEAGDNLHQVHEAAAEQKQRQQEGDVVVAGKDVLHPKAQKAPGRRPDGGVDCNVDGGRGAAGDALDDFIPHCYPREVCLSGRQQLQDAQGEGPRLPLAAARPTGLDGKAVPAGGDGAAAKRAHGAR
jgi:hypothetical protein